MRKEKTLDFGHLSIKIHEPTVEQVRGLLSRGDLTIDPAGFFSGSAEIPTDVLALFTDASPSVIPKLTLSELAEIVAEVEKLLAPFFEVLKKFSILAGSLADPKSNESTNASVRSSE
ncbi:MAG: hypothetical protein WDA41_07415 [Candidatus Neomarinimicrobiota bacterium]|jgi:hypothetical protein